MEGEYHAMSERDADYRDVIPDVRDGLTRLQRLVLYELSKAQRELGRDFVPTVLLYGRVVEHVPITERQLQDVLVELGARGH